MNRRKFLKTAAGVTTLPSVIAGVDVQKIVDAPEPMPDPIVEPEINDSDDIFDIGSEFIIYIYQRSKSIPKLPINARFNLETDELSNLSGWSTNAFWNHDLIGDGKIYRSEARIDMNTDDSVVLLKWSEPIIIEN